jgi:hypothetical protein
VQISPDGSQLVVTEKLTNLIDIYQIAADESLSMPAFAPSVGIYPFWNGLRSNRSTRVARGRFPVR